MRAWNRRFARGLSFVIVSSAAVPVHALPEAQANIPRAIQEADAILTGRVISGQAAAPSLAVVPNRILKGTRGAFGASALSVMLAPHDALRNAVPGPGIDALLFLKRVPDGGWAAMPLFGGGLLLDDQLIRLREGPLPPEHQYAPSDPLIDKVVQELWFGLDASDPDVRSQAHLALFPLFWPEAQPHFPASPFEHARTLGSAHEEACPLLRLSRRWDGDVLARVEALVATSAPVPSGIEGSLCMIRHPSTVPGLGRLFDARPGGAELQRCVVRALHTIHTADALAVLRRALDDRDPEIQYLAVSGFGLYANHYLVGRTRGPTLKGVAETELTKIHSPSIPAFQADPARYIEFWKNWFSQLP